MKKIILILFILISQFSFAQIPQSFKYQAVVRDAAGLLAVNKIISIRTSILSGSATGSSVYTEKQTLSTNDYGVVSLNIGAGTLVAGNFSTINWGASTYFVKTELDINGASTYVFMGTSQILSVPYALYAEKTGSSLSDHDTSATNEIQNLSVVGSNLSISGGNTIALPPDADNNPLNELQNLSITGDSLHISSGNSIYLSGAVDLDASPLNEIQNLSLNGDSLKISMGNNVVFPHDNDRDSINEIQNLSLVGKVISLSKSNSIILADNDSTNEIQSLTLNQGTLKLTKTNTVHLPDSSATNELQTISIIDKTIYLSNGGQVELPIPNFDYNQEFNNFGNGSDGNFVSSGTSTLNNDVKFYDNFWLKPSDSLKIQGTVMIKVKDTCRINGIIYGKGLGGSTVNTLGATGGGGGSYFGCSSGLGLNSPNNVLNYYFKQFVLSGGIASAPYATDSGSVGSSWDSVSINKLLSLNQIFPMNGIKGGQGFNNAGPGSAGGAGIYIICKYLIFDGLINLQGENGRDGYITGSFGPVLTCGSGGGGGGTAVISSMSVLQNTGTSSTTGGFGGNGIASMSIGGCGSLGTTKGGKGGNGSFILINQ